MVSWAICTAPPVCVSFGAASGCIQNAAPFSTVSGWSPLHCVESMPTVEIAMAALPSVTPTVSHESHAAVGNYVTKSGLVPPMSAPNGAAAWKAAGNCIGAADGEPNMV